MTFDFLDPRRDTLRAKILRMLVVVDDDRRELFPGAPQIGGVELFAATTRPERAVEGDDLLWVAAIMDAVQRGEVDAPVISCANPAYPFDFSLRLTDKGRAAAVPDVVLNRVEGGG